MSRILTYLAQILSARYGRDVRQSIHDAIHQCYCDGKAGSLDLAAREQINILSQDKVDYPDYENATVIITGIGSYEVVERGYVSLEYMNTEWAERDEEHNKLWTNLYINDNCLYTVADSSYDIEFLGNSPLYPVKPGDVVEVRHVDGGQCYCQFFPAVKSEETDENLFEDAVEKAVENYLDEYLAENPVQSGATAAQVEQINKNTEDIGNLSKEIADQNKATKDTASLGEELANADNWTLGTGWSGDLASGFTHASGNTEPLTFTPSITAGGLYQVSFKSSVAMTTSNLFVQVGNSTQFNLYGDKLDDGSISIGVLAVDTTGLVFTPESSFTGTLTDISIKEITGSYEAIQQYFDTNKAISLEIHVTPRGLENVFIGQATGEMNTTGHENVGIGANVMAKNTSGFWNVGIGSECLKNNVGGSRNLAIGHNALLNNEVGQRNVALGTFAMTQIKNGNWNIAIGSDSMNTATGGNKNTAVGFNTLVHNNADYNVAFGADVLSNNTNGSRNIGVGVGALANNTTGNDNVCVGYNAGRAITTGVNNVGIGWSSLYKTTTGGTNIAIGYGAGKDITTGKRNIVIGYQPTVDAEGSYQLNIGDLLTGYLHSSSKHLAVNGEFRLPEIKTASSGNNDVYYDEWTFTLEDGSTVTKKVLLV